MKIPKIKARIRTTLLENLIGSNNIAIGYIKK
jgi:hypothetical protein